MTDPMTPTRPSDPHIERPTKMRNGQTYCACGNPWPCVVTPPTDEARATDSRVRELLGYDDPECKCGPYPEYCSLHDARSEAYGTVNEPTSYFPNRVIYPTHCVHCERPPHQGVCR